MSTFPGSPRILKGGIALIDPTTAAVQRIIVMQYNPDSVTRTLQPQGVSDSADKSEALRLKSAAVETIKIEAEIDATDQLGDGDTQATGTGVLPQLSALESLANPTAAQLQNQNSLAQGGALEVAPLLASLAVFIWSKNRVVPVRVTDFSITEEAFDVNLNPIRAKVSLSLRVLTVSELGFDSKGGSLFMSYLRQKESLAARARGSLSALGVQGI
jgi:hypothetical protein